MVKFRDTFSIRFPSVFVCDIGFFFNENSFSCSRSIFLSCKKPPTVIPRNSDENGLKILFLKILEAACHGNENLIFPSPSPSPSPGPGPGPHFGESGLCCSSALATYNQLDRENPSVPIMIPFSFSKSPSQ